MKRLILIIPFLILSTAFAGINQWTLCTTGMGTTPLGYYSIAISPINNQLLYTCGGVFTEQTILFRTTDGGNLWSRMTSFGSDRINRITIAPLSSNTIFLSSAFKQVYKSVDSGNSWAITTTGLSPGDVNLIVVDSTNTNICYAGAGTIFKSIDGGLNWSVSSNGMIYNPGVRAFAIDPTNSAILYAGTNYGYVYKSIDTGANWSLITTGLPVTTWIDIAINPLNSQEVYAVSFSQGVVYKSANAGTTWSAFSSGLNSVSVIQVITFLPGDPNTVFIGNNKGVYRSIDSGTTWSSFTTGFSSYPLSIYQLVITRNPPYTLYATSDYGVWSYTISATEINNWQRYNDSQPNIPNPDIKLSEFPSSIK